MKPPTHWRRHDETATIAANTSRERVRLGLVEVDARYMAAKYGGGPGV